MSRPTINIDELLQDATDHPFRKLDVVAEKWGLSYSQIVRLSKKTKLAKKMRQARKEKVLSLSQCNPTLSMDSLAAHYGVSPSWVAKVMEEK